MSSLASVCWCRIYSVDISIECVHDSTLDNFSTRYNLRTQVPSMINYLEWYFLNFSTIQFYVHATTVTQSTVYFPNKIVIKESIQNKERRICSNKRYGTRKQGWICCKAAKDVKPCTNFTTYRTFDDDSLNNRTQVSSVLEFNLVSQIRFCFH